MWQELFAKRMFKLQWELPPGDALRVSLTSLHSGAGVEAVRVYAQPCVLSNTSAFSAQKADKFSLWIMTGGSGANLERGDAQIVLRPSMGALLDEAAPYRFTCTNSHPNGYMLSFPKDRVGFENSHRHAPPLDLSSRPFRLLQSFLTLLNEELDEPTMARLNGDYILDLIALALNARGEAEAVARGRGLPAARHRLIVAEIERGFADAALSGKMVAARLGITERYLQQLMEQRGETFSHHVLRVRLERAAAMLTTKKHMPVAEVAFRCGFNDLSYFNRTFRRRFGDSPRAYRK